MTILAIVIAVLAVLIIGYFIIFPAGYRTSASLEFPTKPPAEVCALAADLTRQRDWSPWLIHDPDCKLEHGGADPGQTGSWHSWDSEKVGKGKLTITKLEPGKHIAQHLEFIKPFKSVCQVTWDFETSGEGGTKATWTMDSRLPFFLRFLRKSMMKWVATDFGYGLLRLRHCLDAEQPTMEFSFDGPCERPAINFLGRSFRGSIEAMKKDMQEHFAKIAQLKPEGEERASLTRTDKFNHITEEIAVAYGIEAPADATEEGYQRFEAAGGKYLKTTCTGSYDYMNYAWHNAFGSVQMSKNKLDKSRQGYELYAVGPDKTDKPSEYVTEIYLPIK